MAGVHQVLKQAMSKYKYADIAKRDVTNAMRQFQDLRPSHDCFTFNNGGRKYLLNLDGTIPVQYKGRVFNIPIGIWILDTHPYNPPIVFVKPTNTMQIKSGRHVDSNGKVDLPYLRDWRYPQSDLLGLIQILVIVFGEEPPVFSRAAPAAQSLPPYTVADPSPYQAQMPYPMSGFGYPMVLPNNMRQASGYPQYPAPSSQESGFSGYPGAALTGYPAYPAYPKYSSRSNPYGTSLPYLPYQKYTSPETNTNTESSDESTETPEMDTQYSAQDSTETPEMDTQYSADATETPEMDALYSAQDILLCDLCQTDALQSHCELCHLNLCIVCVGKHLSDASKRHNVVPYRHKTSTVTPNYPKCSNHMQKNCELYCEKCKIPVCTACLSSGKHKGHNLSDALQKLSSTLKK